MTSPTKDLTSGLSDDEILAMVDKGSANIRRMLPKPGGVIRGQLADVEDKLKEQPIPPPQPAPAITRAGDPSAQIASAPVPDADEDDDEEELEDDDEQRPVASFRSSFGQPLQQAAQMPTAQPTGQPVPAGDINARIKQLEDQNAYLLNELRQLPGLIQRALQGGAAQAPAGMGAAPAGAPGGLPNIIGVIGQLAGVAKQIGLFGDGAAAAKDAGADNFIEKMGQYMQIQQQLEQLQTAKFENTARWLARIGRIFGAETFKHIAGDDDKQPQITSGPAQVTAALVPAVKTIATNDDDE